MEGGVSLSSLMPAGLVHFQIFYSGRPGPHREIPRCPTALGTMQL